MEEVQELPIAASGAGILGTLETSEPSGGGWPNPPVQLGRVRAHSKNVLLVRCLGGGGTKSVSAGFFGGVPCKPPKVQR